MEKFLKQETLEARDYQINLRFHVALKLQTFPSLRDILGQNWGFVPEPNMIEPKT